VAEPAVERLGQVLERPVDEIDDHLTDGGLAWAMLNSLESHAKLGPMLPFVHQFLMRPGWLAGFLGDGGMMKFPNVVLPGQGAMPYADVGAALEQSMVCWEDLRWIREAWSGPIIVKGVHTGDDARRAADMGAAAVVVSNHGGRQLDGVAATLRVLPEVVAAVGGLLVPLVLAATVDVWWFNRPAAAHLRHAVHFLQTALHLTNEPNPDVPVLQPMTLRERYDTVFVYWTFGRGTDIQVLGFVGGLLAALLIRWKWRSSAGILVWLVAFAITTGRFQR